MLSTGDKLIIEFAKMFAIKQVDSAILESALEKVCREFSFDCGAIYQIDQFGQINLKEHYSMCATEFQATFHLEEIGREYLAELNKDALVYIEKGEEVSECETKFLRILKAESMLVSSAAEGDLSIEEFTIFYNIQKKAMLHEGQREVLSALMIMLGRFASGRLQSSKIEFVKHSLESILDNTGIDIYVNDFYTHEILYVNKSMAAPYGGVEQFMGNKCWQILFPGQNGPCEFCPQKKIVDENGNPTKLYTWDYQRAFDGLWFRVFSAAFRWIDGRTAHVVSSADITDNKRNEEIIQYMANYDSLTNLPNRRMLVADCGQRIGQAKEGQKGYVLFFDLDGFKKINDTLGHDAGDEFLVEIGKFFAEIPLLKNSIYRNGGDEFVAIIDGDITEVSVRNLIRFIQLRFEKPWHIKSGAVFAGVSVGVSCFPENGVTVEELLNKADKAMYVAKKNGGGGFYFARDM